MKSIDQMTDEDWKQVLSKEEYRVLRQKGTERAGTGRYLHNKEEGIYVCAGCGTELFKSDVKYNSGSGWPSFFSAIGEIAEERDENLNITRTEILCKKCGGHLGHVFTDGPKPTGMRYCVNGTSLKFKKKED